MLVRERAGSPTNQLDRQPPVSEDVCPVGARDRRALLHADGREEAYVGAGPQLRLGGTNTLDLERRVYPAEIRAPGCEPDCRDAAVGVLEQFEVVGATMGEDGDAQGELLALGLPGPVNPMSSYGPV
ncbi:hypothetical protein GCM10017712_25770 [Curtobacterium citreum]